MNGYMTAMRRYAEFSGRSARPEYWFFVLIYFLISIVAGIIDWILGTGFGGQVGIVGIIVGLIHLIPGIAVAVRRLHDTDRTGWWILIVFIPLIGMIWLIVLYCLPGTPGANRYGEPTTI